MRPVRPTMARKHVARGLLPYVGAVLFAVPLLWSASSTAVQASSAMIYIFVVWLFLIVACAVLTRSSSLRDRGDKEVTQSNPSKDMP